MIQRKSFITTTRVGSSEQAKLEWCLLGQGGQGKARKQLEESSGTLEVLLLTWTTTASCGHSSSCFPEVYAHHWLQKQGHHLPSYLPCPSPATRVGARPSGLPCTCWAPGVSPPTPPTTGSPAWAHGAAQSQPSSSSLVAPFLLFPSCHARFPNPNTHTHTQGN